jgi:hypothetical protein
LALADSVRRGELVEDTHLRVTYIGADAPVAHLDEADRERLVGQAALVDLGEGTIVTPEQFGEPASVTAAGDGTVGLTLEAGQLPTLPLAIGDRVSVVGPPSAGAGANPAAAARLASAEVVGTEQLDDESGDWWVSLRATEADAETVAAAASGGARLQLVLVGR